MSRRKTTHPLIALPLALTLLLSSGTALARHDADTHVTTATAHTLKQWEWSVGTWDVAWGPLSWLTVSTYIWPWFAKVPSLSAKWRIWHNDEWAFSWRLGFFSLDLQNLNKDAAPATFKVVPSELTVSYRLLPSLELSLSGIYTPVVMEGSYDTNDLEGAAGYSNVQAGLALEWRLSESWALWLRTRHLLKLDLSAQAAATTQLDPYTKMTVHGGGSVKDLADMGFPQTFNIVPGVAYSGDTFNLEAGLGYGAFNVPGVNFMLPSRSLVPYLDMYWRF